MSNSASLEQLAYNAVTSGRKRSPPDRFGAGISIPDGADVNHSIDAEPSERGEDMGRPIGVAATHVPEHVGVNAAVLNKDGQEGGEVAAGLVSDGRVWRLPLERCLVVEWDGKRGAVQGHISPKRDHSYRWHVVTVGEHNVSTKSDEMTTLAILKHSSLASSMYHYMLEGRRVFPPGSPYAAAFHAYRATRPLAGAARATAASGKAVHSHVGGSGLSGGSNGLAATRVPSPVSDDEHDEPPVPALPTLVGGGAGGSESAGHAIGDALQVTSPDGARWAVVDHGMRASKPGVLWNVVKYADDDTELESRDMQCDGIHDPSLRYLLPSLHHYMDGHPSVQYLPGSPYYDAWAGFKRQKKEPEAAEGLRGPPAAKRARREAPNSSEVKTVNATSTLSGGGGVDRTSASASASVASARLSAPDKVGQLAGGGGSSSSSSTVPQTDPKPALPAEVPLSPPPVTQPASKRH